MPARWKLLLARGHLVAGLLVIHSLAAACQARVAIGSMQVPDDFVIEGLSGGLHPWEENFTLRVGVDGQGRYTRFFPRDVGAPPLERGDFALSEKEVAVVWEAVEANDFFSLPGDHRDASIRGGSFASLTVTANGTTHRVRVQNVSLPRFEAVLATLNQVTPPGHDLIYRSPDAKP